jgi:hypothetical protein
MATVTVEVNGRPYAVGCADGQEDRVRMLARQFDDHVRHVAGEVGHVGDAGVDDGHNHTFTRRGLPRGGESVVFEPVLRTARPVSRCGGRHNQPGAGTRDERRNGAC